jgi:hypothetical protein
MGDIMNEMDCVRKHFVEENSSDIPGPPRFGKRGYFFYDAILEILEILPKKHASRLDQSHLFALIFLFGSYLNYDRSQISKIG